MGKRFHCGRSMLTRDGTINKVVLKYDGCTRLCDWYNGNMTLKDVHYRLLDIFIT
jgi:hypothetical protein